MLEKAFLKFPKSATQISGLKRTPPLELFRKFIGFGCVTLPLYIRQLPFALLSITMIVFQGVVLVSKKLAAIPDIQVFVQVILV